MQVYTSVLKSPFGSQISGERPLVPATRVDHRRSDLINHKVIQLVKVQQLQWEEATHKSQIWVRQSKGWILCLHSYLFPPQIIMRTFRKVLLSSQCRSAFFFNVKKSNLLLSSILFGSSERHLKKATKYPSLQLLSPEKKSHPVCNMKSQKSFQSPIWTCDSCFALWRYVSLSLSI